MKSGLDINGNQPEDDRDIDERLAPESLDALSSDALRDLLDDLHGGALNLPPDMAIETLRAYVASTINGEY